MTDAIVGILKHPDCAPGTWWWTEGNGAPTVSCGGCQKLHGLDHEVFEDGTLSDSVVCTRCGWHVKIRLLNWTHGRKDFRVPA